MRMAHQRPRRAGRDGDCPALLPLHNKIKTSSGVECCEQAQPTSLVWGLHHGEVSTLRLQEHQHSTISGPWVLQSASCQILPGMQSEAHIKLCHTARQPVKQQWAGVRCCTHQLHGLQGIPKDKQHMAHAC